MAGESAAAGTSGPAGASHDPYPFGKDPWWGKAIILLIVLLPLAAIGYGVWRLWGNGVGPLELGLLFGFWAVSGLGVSVGFHRMLTHRAFTAKPVTRFVVLAAGAMALEGPPDGWAATHLRHHAKADREGDPHSPLEGFWHAHVAWLLRDRMVHGGTAYQNIRQDPIVRWVSDTWILWALLSLALPAAIGWWVYGTLQGALDAFVWGGLIRVFLVHHTTWSVNSVGHMFGTRPFRTNDRGANNAVVALFGWGEGWHNNHHAFPKSAYLGLRWWQVDPGAWVVWFLRAIRQIDNVWKPGPKEMQDRQA